MRHLNVLCMYPCRDSMTVRRLTSSGQAGMAPSAPSHCDHETGDKLLTSPDCFERFERS